MNSSVGTSSVGSILVAGVACNPPLSAQGGSECVCGGGGDTILKRKACMGLGVGAQRRGPVPKRMSDENHHDCTGPP